MSVKHEKPIQRTWADRKERLSVSGLSVSVDWYALLALLLILFVGFVASAWLLYRSILAETVLDASVQAAMRTNVNEAQLTRVVETFTERTKQFDELTRGFRFTEQQIEVPFDDTE